MQHMILENGVYAVGAYIPDGAKIVTPKPSDFHKWDAAAGWVIDEEIVALHQSTQYIRDRQFAYPPITDYLDGIVKGDQAQVDKYIADCLAVKARFPKP